MIEGVSVIEAEYIGHAMVRELMNYNEPPAEFHTRYPGRLESCLDHPFAHVGGRYVYWTLHHRAAVLFYLVIKNHPFQNGNKRMAVALMLIFLYKNKQWIDTSPEGLYVVAKRVAESKPNEKDVVIEALKRFLKKHGTPLVSPYI